MKNARPHPDPLPRERERTGEGAAVGIGGVMGAARWYGVFVRNRRRIIGVLIAVIFVGVVVAVVGTREQEPVYQGKKLSEWIELYGTQVSLPDSLPKNDPDVEAVRHIGTNALPFLLRWIRDDSPSWTKKWNGIAARLPAKIRNNSYLAATGDEHSLSSAAAWAFLALGPKASPAVPELVRIASSTSNPNASQNAVYALGCIGMDGFPALLTILSNPRRTPAIRSRAAWMVGFRRDLGTNGDLAVPILIKSLRDTDEFVAMGAATTLGNLGLQPEVVVPALIGTMQDERNGVRRFAVEALGKFGPRAKAAVPALQDLATGANGSLQLTATNALQKIAPEVLGTDGTSHF